MESEITLEGPETEYVTLAVVEYDPYEGMIAKETKKARRLFVCRHSANKLAKMIRSRSAEDLTWTRGLKASRGMLPKNGSGRGTCFLKATYEVRGPRLHMLLLGFDQSLTSLPVVETKIEEVRVEN